MQWDPHQYGRYADARGRPFLDLVTRVGSESPRRVVDLGCGPGNLTALLATRWPDARIEGIDSSPQMIDAAAARASTAMSFRLGDIAEWSIPTDAEVVISNAALQWVPRHRELLSRWAAELPVGGWLAWQVPGNFDAPSHRLMRELAGSPRWAPLLGGVLRHDDAVAEPGVYAQLLLDAGLRADVWETTYLHLLPGTDPVLDWMRGTALRPLLAALPPANTTEFEASYGAALRAAYPATRHGTLFAFRRIFAVGHRP